MHEAALYTADDQQRVFCGLCSHRCIIGVGKRGICGVRENRGGLLVSLVYGKVVTEHVDPIEKKPLYHFLPGSKTYSIATVGCNFQCVHCQNAEISQYPHHHHNTIAGKTVSHDKIVEAALAHGCQSISYTYVEPTIFFEYSRDCALLARKHGLRNVYVSNGYMTPEAGSEIAEFVDGINIDIKSFRDDFYRKVCKASLEPVLSNVELFFKRGAWVEVTTLLIPGLNDSPQELRELAAFIKNISADIPWHVSAFRPAYRMKDRSATDPSTLKTAVSIGKEVGLNHIYMGNVYGTDADTVCPNCGDKVVYRSNFNVKINDVHLGACPSCLEKIAGVWG